MCHPWNKELHSPSSSLFTPYQCRRNAGSSASSLSSPGASPAVESSTSVDSSSVYLFFCLLMNVVSCREWVATAVTRQELQPSCVSCSFNWLPAHKRSNPEQLLQHDWFAVRIRSWSSSTTSPPSHAGLIPLLTPQWLGITSSGTQWYYRTGGPELAGQHANSEFLLYLVMYLIWCLLLDHRYLEHAVVTVFCICICVYMCWYCNAVMCMLI